MVDQLPNLGREKEMLQEMGFDSIDALFADVPYGRPYERRFAPS